MAGEGRQGKVVLITGKGEELKKYERKNQTGRKRKGEVMNQMEKEEDKKVKMSSGSTSEMAEVEKVEDKKVKMSSVSISVTAEVEKLEERKVRKTRGSTGTATATATAAKESLRRWPVRERKVVERFSFPPERELASMSLFIKKGKGMKLKDISNVAYKLSKRKADNNLQMLHTILFGKKSNKYNMKRNISQFSGFVWTQNEEKERAKLKEKIDKCVKECLFDFCELLDIPVTKESEKVKLSVKLLEFLESPHATTDVLLARKRQSKRGNKRTRTVNMIKASSPEELAEIERSLEEHTTDDDVCENEEQKDELEEQEEFLPEEENTQVKNAPQEKEQEQDTQGENEAHAEAQVGPSNEEVFNMVSGLLKEVDFEVVTFSDILKRIEAYFNTRLSHRKVEIRNIIETVIINMMESEEEGEEREDSEDDA